MRIGVTGIYASGKGTVCEMFKELGARIIDTDIIAREIVKPGTVGLEAIIREFGMDILNEDKTLNRRKLANIVFANPKRVKRLNEITHPLILDKAIEIADSSPSNIFMVNTPLLFESGFDKHMDKTIVVTAKTNQVIERGLERDDITEREIRERLNNQNSLKEKIKKADYVIDNSYSIDNTKRQVLEIWKTLQKLRKRR